MKMMETGLWLQKAGELYSALPPSIYCCHLHLLIHHSRCKFCYHSNTNQKRKLSLPLTCGTSQLCSSRVTAALNFHCRVNDHHQSKQNSNEPPCCKWIIFFIFYFFGTEIPSLEFMKGEKQLKAILFPSSWAPLLKAEGVQTRRPGETTSALVLNRIYAF